MSEKTTSPSSLAEVRATVKLLLRRRTAIDEAIRSLENYNRLREMQVVRRRRAA